MAQGPDHQSGIVQSFSSEEAEARESALSSLAGDDAPTSGQIQGAPRLSETFTGRAAAESRGFSRVSALTGGDNILLGNGRLAGGAFVIRNGAMHRSAGEARSRSRVFLFLAFVTGGAGGRSCHFPQTLPPVTRQPKQPWRRTPLPFARFLSDRELRSWHRAGLCGHGDRNCQPRRRAQPRCRRQRMVRA